MANMYNAVPVNIVRQIGGHYRATAYEVHVGAAEPLHDRANPDESSTRGTKVSGPHYSWRAVQTSLARARRRHPFAWVVWA
jgi:hypothetical protein